MLLSSPVRPEPELQRPASAPMSPIPGTLQIPPSGWSSASLLFTASRTAGAVLADSAVFTDWAEVAERALVAACAAGELVAADAGRDMNSPLNTTASIAAASSRARAGRRAGRVRPARGRGSAISGGSCIRRFFLRGCRRLWLPTGSFRICVDPVPEVLGYEIDADAARAVVEITENTFTVAQGTKVALVLLGRLNTEKRKHVRHLGTFRRAERENTGDAVGHLFVQQVPRILRDEYERRVPRAPHPGHLGDQLRALGRGRDRPRLVEEDRLRGGPVHRVHQPSGELGDQVQQRHRKPLLVRVVFPSGVGGR